MALTATHEHSNDGLKPLQTTRTRKAIMYTPTAQTSDQPAATLARDAQTGDSTIRMSRRVAADLVGLADGVAVVLGSLVPALIYRWAGDAVIDWRMVVQAAICAAIITHLVLRFWGHYEASRLHEMSLSPAALLGALCIGLFSTAGLSIPASVRIAHEVIWMLTWMSASISLMVIGRGVACWLLARLTATGYFDERVAVFGAGPIARQVHAYLSQSKSGTFLAGIFDDRCWPDRVDCDGLPMTGTLADLIDLARAQKIDKIIIALPQTASVRFEAIAKRLEDLPVSLHIVTHLATDYIGNAKTTRVSNLGPVGLFDIKKKALSDWQPFIKRAEDIVVGSLLLLISLPLFPLIAAAIRIESAGPVFFRQRRRGFNQDIIEIYKFRTMRVLEDGPHVRQATFGDDRVTRIGRILRRTSLDELPQLINVLQGNMSLVGPRPHALAHDTQFSEILEHYATRHQVKPGLTGLAQVRGLRGETSTAMSLEARVNADIAYIKNWSLSLDLLILSQTVWAVITAKNAH